MGFDGDWQKMAIPDFQSLMLPILNLAADQEDHKSPDLAATLADQFALSSEERVVRISSGARVFANRVAWAISDLKRARVLQSPARGVYRITPLGLSLLATNPPFLSRKGLAAWAPSDTPPVEMLDGNGTSTLTPSEMIDEGFRAIRQELASTLLEQLRATDWARFEAIVVDVLVRMGYGGSYKDAGEILGKSGDQGVDGVIRQDPLGLESVYVQAKQWAGAVGRPQVQAFVGSLEGLRARKGVMITTSKFTDEAIQYARHLEKTVVLVSGERLSELMIEHGIRVINEQTYTIKRLDSSSAIMR